LVSAAANRDNCFFYFSSPVWQCQSALLSSASEVKVGWRAETAAAAAAGWWAGNDPPVIIFQTFFKFLVT